MRAPTHITFGIFFYFILCSLIGIQFQLVNIFFVVFGSLLPDIDINKSFMGRIFFFISSKIEKKFEHRTITHSFLFVLTIYFIFKFIFKFFPQYQYINAPIIIGILSHIFIDCFNKSGVDLLYPASVSFVLPGNKDYRVQVGSNVEYILLFIFLGLTLLFYTVAKVGIIKTMHSFLGDIGSAVSDYQDYAITNEVFTKLTAVDNLTNKFIIGDYKIIGRGNKNVLIIEVQNQLKTVGDNEDSNWRPVKIRVYKTKPVNYIIQKIDLSFSELSEIKKYLNKNYEQYLYGELEPLNQLIQVKNSFEYYSPIIIKNSNLVFNNARYKDIERNELENIYIKSGEIIIKTIISKNQTFKPLELETTVNSNQDMKFTNKFEIILTIEEKEEILVKKGDKVKKGQILAHIKRKEKEVSMKEADILILQKELDTIENNTELFSKITKQKSLNFELDSLNSDYARSQSEISQNIAILTKQVKILKEEKIYAVKKHNRIDILKFIDEIENKQDEITKLKESKHIIPNDLQLKIFNIKNMLLVTTKEIENLQLKNIKDISRLKILINKANLEKTELILKSNIESPVNGIVANIDFTMSVEYLMRANLMLLENND